MADAVVSVRRASGPSAGAFARNPSLVAQTLVFAALMCVIVAAAQAVAGGAAAVGTLAAGCAAVAFFIAVSVRRHREIMRLAAEVDEVLHDGRRLSFTDCREGDVAVLCNEVSKMVARLSRATGQLEHEKAALAEALADVSHQIRTPLTAAALMTAGIERADDAQERKRSARELAALLDRISWLVVALLKIAKVDAGAIALEPRDVPVREVIDRAVRPLAPVFDLHGVELEVSGRFGAELDEACLHVDGAWVAEALENVVKNCMEHTPAGGTVRVEVEDDVLATRIVVSDTGPGIDPEDLPHLFERFYRGGADMEAFGPQGFGIGLSLAQSLVTACGGTVRADNGEGGGARFELRFPKMVV